jgi:glucuronate isomerase
MKQFLGDDFLLDSDLAKKLYNEHAKDMPIFDFHCHLLPQQIAEDYHFSSITEAWLGANGYGDHYKWRLLRELGVKEELITGKKSDWERFKCYADSMPYFIGNPIYEWTHLELRKYFGITKVLGPDTAKEIYEEANEKLKTLSARKMMAINHVDTVFTTDDPVDDLHYHEIMAKDKSLKVTVHPCFRPDKAINCQRPTFIPWVKKLSEVTGKPITNLADMLACLDERLAFFVKHQCSASDHALDVVHYKKATYAQAQAVFKKAMANKPISFDEEDIYKGYVMLHLGKEYHRYNMVQQYHIGALRNNSLRNYARMGADTGYDAVEDKDFAEKLSALLNALDETDELPKTVLYTLNEKDYVVLATLMNCFQGEGYRGKIQLGTSWWFNDCYDGMMTQMKRLANDGLISCFVGMLTDSRSFLSYPRHDYFRRELCSFLASLVEQGRYPDNEKTLGKIVEDVSYNNAKKYFSR